MFVWNGLPHVVVGLAGGLSAAFYLTRLVASMFYEVEPSDPLTYISVACLVVISALLATWLPARRATSVDPMVALRCE
jgi:putative ABC transport system permease protein